MSEYLFHQMVNTSPALRGLTTETVTIPAVVQPVMSARETLLNPDSIHFLVTDEDEYKALQLANKTINQIRQRIYNPEKTQWFYKAMIAVLPITR